MPIGVVLERQEASEPDILPKQDQEIMAPMNEQAEDWRSKLAEEASPSVHPDDLARAREPGRGREASTPTDIPARGWKDILWRMLWSIPENRILSTSGGVAF